MKILVLGASGGVGQHLVRIAHEKGHVVTAVMRSKGDVPAGVNLVIDDVKRDGCMEAVVPGHDAVLSSLGLKRKNPANPFSALDSPADFASSTARSLVVAMKKHGVKRVIAVSADGVGDSAPGMNWLMKLLVSASTIGAGYRDLNVMEKVYAKSGLDFCCVRPTTLTTGPQTNRVRRIDNYPVTASISRADVAAWMIEHLSADLSADRFPIITG